MKGPKKGEPFGMCKHVLAGKNIADAHWYYQLTASRRNGVSYWVCLCETCHVDAERDSGSRLPIAAYGASSDDVVIDEGGN